MQKGRGYIEQETSIIFFLFLFLSNTFLTRNQERRAKRGKGLCAVVGSDIGYLNAKLIEKKKLQVELMLGNR